MWTVDVLDFTFFIIIIQNSLQPLRGLSHFDNYISEGSISHINCVVRSYSELFWVLELITALPNAPLSTSL